MWKRINDVLGGLPATLIGGIFLLLSFLLPRVGYPVCEALAWVCVIICGIPLIYLAIWRVIHNKGIAKISSALLISIAMIAAIAIGDLFAAGEVAFIMEIGALLEDQTTERAKKGLRNLISLTPRTGRRILSSGAEVIPAEQICLGDILRVLPGESIPVDGEIIRGETSVDQSVITGESLPVDKTVGDSVFCGTINRFGAVDIRASKVGEDSSLQKLIRMVQEAENHQAPAQRIADRWASWLVPVALLIGIAAFLVTGNIVRAVTVLVVFCPCALVLATPTAIMAAIGQATKHGVIIKSGEALEKMGHVDTVAFDKTGTLTYGILTVSDVISPGGMAEEELISLAAGAEAKSEHPLGKAITAYAKSQDIAFPESESFEMTAGKGVHAIVKGHDLLLGNKKYLLEHAIRISFNAKERLEKLRDEGKASVLVAEHGAVIGIIALSDALRPEVKAMVEKLEAMGVKTVLLSGDHQKTAEHFAAQVGIRQVFADLLPEEKVSHLAALMEQGNVCMIGDGVNDAPALKTANVGVAMGAMGSDIAVDAADVALMTDDISRIPYLKWLGNATVNTIRGAITLSMSINFVAVTLSVLGILTPTTGALVHNAGSCFVVLLAALLYDRKYTLT